MLMEISHLQTEIYLHIHWSISSTYVRFLVGIGLSEGNICGIQLITNPAPEMRAYWNNARRVIEFH